MLHKKTIGRLLAITLAVMLLTVMLPASFMGGVASAAGEPFTNWRAELAFRDSDKDVDERVDSIMNEMTFSEKQSFSQGSGSAIARLGVSGSSAGGGGGDRLHGDGQGTLPSPLGNSQSWDQNLYRRIGTQWMKASGTGGSYWMSVDILRDPRYGRAYETYGEDGFLTGKLVTAIGRGSEGGTIDSNGYQSWSLNLKHFMGYGTETMRYWLNSSMPLRAQYEYFVKPFYYPATAGVARRVMTSYPVVNGKPIIVSHLLGKLLNEWTPDYFFTSNDAYSGSWMYLNQQRYFPDTFIGRTMAVSYAAKMGNQGWSLRNVNSHGDYYFEGYARGILTEDDLEPSARRIVTAWLRSGSIDQIGSKLAKDAWAARILGADERSTQAGRQLNLEVSQAGIVLLKNDDNILPLKSADPANSKVVLLGTLSDTVMYDHYTGTRPWAVSIKTALGYKLGASNVLHDHAVDTVAIKASNGNYLENKLTTVSYQGNAASMNTVTATGTGAPTMTNSMAFEVWDFNFWQFLRSPLNGMFLRNIVPSTSGSVAVGTGRYGLINDTRLPGIGNNGGTTAYATGETSGTGSNNVHWTPHAMFRIVPTTDNKLGIYAPMSGNGRNMPTQLTGGLQWGGTMNPSNADEEDLNNGAYLGLNGLYNYDGTGTTFPGSSNTSNLIEADFRTQGPWVNQDNVLTSKADTLADDGKVDNLPETDKFEFEYLQTAEQAALAQINAAPDAPIVLVLGTDSWQAGEARDLQYTGLGQQPKDLIKYLTDDLGRDIILVLKTGNPMPIDREVADNPGVKAILTMGHTGMHEGVALASVLYDNGTTVPTTGYSGYLGPAGNGVIPAYSPAGRLSATWYDGEDQMKGGMASGTYAPVSYRWPAFDEDTNNNFSNMNGSYSGGLQMWDIIKGERTYQYLNEKPLYAFGHGLSYGDFAYSDVAVSAISNGAFVVTGKVKNNGAYTSDEVAEVYSSFVGTPSRIKQANKRLIGFERLYSIAPGEIREFSIPVTNIRDELGVYDVERGALVVENGNYLIRVGGTSELSSLPGNNTTLTVSALDGGVTLPSRNLNILTMAEAFDDQSDVGGKVMDIEIVAANAEDYDCNYAVSFRENGSWISFKDAFIPAGTAKLTASIGSDRIANMKVYALPAGSPESALATATPIAVMALTDTRAKSGLPNNLGIGGNTNGGGSPGSVRGQATADNYLWAIPRIISVDVNVAEGLYDIYFVDETRGARFEWFKFGATLDPAVSVEIFDSYNYDSIRTPNGTVQLRAALTPSTAADTVVWSIEDGATYATINAATGLLTATGAGNGTVKVKATAGSASVVKDIMVTNQSPSDRFNVSGTTYRYIDYLTMRGTDHIDRYKGSTTMSISYWSLDLGYPDTSWLAGGNTQIGDAGSATLWGFSWSAMAVSNLTWSVEALDGGPTDLATVNPTTAVVTATGAGNGRVRVVGTLNVNPDIKTTREITIENQEGNDAYKTIVPVAHYDLAAEAPAHTGTSTAATQASAYSVSATTGLAGNQTGTYFAAAANNVLLFRDVDFGDGANGVYFRLAGTANTTITVRVLDPGGSTTAGTEIYTGTIGNSGSTANYANFGGELSQVVTGKHDISVQFSAATRLSYFQFTPDLSTLAEAIAKFETRFSKDWTPASWTVAQAAYETALDVYDTDANADYDDVKNAKDELNAALDNMDKIYVQPTVGQAPSFVIRKNMIMQIKVDTNAENLTFISSNPTIAMVTPAGVVTGKSIGVAVIQVKDQISGQIFNFVINVTN